MDGFVKSAEDASTRGCGSTNPPTPVCLPSSPPDVMGYHDAREIPNYWTYAKDFVLQDHMFEPVDSWSLPVAPVPGQRLVGALHQHEPRQLHQ